MKRFALVVCLGTAAALAQTTPDDLIQLIRHNDLAALRATITSANVNAHDGRDTTLLMYAAGYGSLDAMKLLLASGADVNAKTQFDATALIYGAGNVEKARLLVEKGADVNAKTRSGTTPLMIAAACEGCAPTVKLLLSKGADAKATNSMGGDALIGAAIDGSAESVQLLLSSGADAKRAAKSGDTALGLGATTCNLDIIKLLLARGADPNAANFAAGEVKFGKVQLYGLTPLMMVSAYCSPAVARTLLDAGAKTTVADVRGMTPLHFAVSSEQQDPAVARLLIKAGSDINAKTKTGETPLDWAQKFGNKEVIAALTSAGGRPGVPYTAPVHKPVAAMQPLASVEKATALLQQSAGEFFRQSGCVGCHHQPAALTAASVARRAGAKVNEPLAESYVKMSEGMTRNFQQLLVERGNAGGSFDPFMTMLNAFAEADYKPTPVTDIAATYVASYQHRDGSWSRGGISRAPMEESTIARTALSLRALQAYSTPGLRAEFDARIARARDFLLKAKAKTNDDAAMQIAGLHWAGVSQEKIQPLARALVAAQRADGGWSQNRNLTSDAYGTGEALWALQLSGAVKPADAAYQKGVQYLLSTQWEDGSWYVRSRAPKFQPYFQSGFPFDHDQWISAAATSWAVRGIAPALSKN
jgi:ankyrin repeat protein